MNTFTLGACFQHELHTGPYFMTFAPRLIRHFVSIVPNLILTRNIQVQGMGSSLTPSFLPLIDCC